MAISVNWATKVITVPRADMPLIQSSPFEVRQLNLDDFRMALKNLEDNEEGIPFLDTHRHNTEVSVGGVVLAMVIEIINGYTITFEDGQYAVNLVGANSNIVDVVNINQVSLRSFNSAGLQIVSVGSGLTTEEHDRLMATAVETGGKLEDVEDAVSTANANILDLLSDLGFVKDIEGGKWEIDGDEMIFYRADNLTEVARFTITRDTDGNPIMRERI